MTDDAPTPALPDDVDADAILRRRDFLVQSALVASALGTPLASACVCLDDVPQPIPDSDNGDDSSQPEVCLGARPPDADATDSEET